MVFPIYLKMCIRDRIKAATNYAGGLVGANAALLASCYMENCYSAGAVDESTLAGAVAGTESGTKGITIC